MRHLFILATFLIVVGCAKTDYGFERVEGAQSVALPVKFDSLYGLRDGESVKAQARFVGGRDSVQMNIAVNLGPPVQFKSGTYVATVGERTGEGIVACESLSFLGGQAALPSVGGFLC